MITLGFLGTGWIGRNRMEAMLATGEATAVAICDPDAEMLEQARAAAPTALSSGTPFETARDYLLDLPGMPQEVADQLRGYSADGTTLPLPVPADEATASETEVDGVPATLLASRDGAFTAVVWVDEGVVTAVAGSLDADEVLSVAEELR